MQQDAPRCRAVDQLADGFFGYLAKLPEARGLLTSPELLAAARRLKREHLIAMVSGDYGAAYVEQRLALAQIYSRGGLEPRCSSARSTTCSPRWAVVGDRYTSLRKVAFFDIGLIVDVIVHERERVIRLQSEAIRELSTRCSSYASACC